MAAMTHPTTVDTRAPIDANTHAVCASALSWVLQGNRALARDYISRLSEDNRDRLMEAAAILVAITGGVSEEALVAEAALNPDGIGVQG